MAYLRCDRSVLPAWVSLIAVCLAIAQASCGSSSRAVTGPSSDKCAVEAQPDPATFPADGGRGTLRVGTNRECAWSAESRAAWLQLPNPAGGQGEGSLAFSVAANTDPPARTGSITVNDREIRVSQQGTPCEFRLSSEHETVGGAGGERTIEVSASSAMCEWSATADVAWIAIVSDRQGRGGAAVTLRVEALAGSPRTGTVTIAGRTVRVDQSTQPTSPSPSPPGQCTSSVTSATQSFGAAGGEGEIRVAAGAGCAWTAESEAPWIAITAGNAGSGSGVVRFRVAATSGPTRIGRLRVAGRFIEIQQSQGCAYTVEPLSHNAAASGGSAAVTVHTAEGCAWSAGTGSSWVTIVSGASGTGAGRVEFSVAANTGPQRSGSLTVAGRTVAVAQAGGCTYSISPTTVDFPGAGATRSVSVSTAAGCPWRTGTDLGWVQVEPASATGPGQAQLTAPANTSPPRSGEVSIAGRDVAVTQASQCSYALVPPVSFYDASGGSGGVLVLVTGPCTWTADSTVGWIRVAPGSASGTGEGVVIFTVSPNSGAARTGTIQIGGQSHTVTQAGR